ncbi:response regulator [Henriciella mobilis]|uniref:response regulator n=1 Tax=Henriciella mobilis TaxID=2305467 RepID=UPI000E661E2F|nr:response regulator [Henriciella mobilis]RIJ15115.1 response regulator [Henriciella mobilis]RIJ20285.1 response regulator [Henriciella mobilis]
MTSPATTDETRIAEADDELGLGTGRLDHLDLLQLAFWGCLLIAVAAASVAIAWPDAVGNTGPILLISMAAGGMVFLLWVLKGAGRRLGLFPQRGAAADAVNAQMPRFGWIESLDEAVLIADQGGAPIAANERYRELTRIALAGQQDSAGPVTVDRIFSASPGLAAPIFRLSKSAKTGDAHREVLPAMTIGSDALPVQYEASVSPLPRGRIIWRLRRINGAENATGAADMKALYVEDAPIGFFAAKPDGTLTYANGWLRELIGLPETAKNVRLDDIMRPEFVKMLGRDKKSGAPGRANIMIRTRDGVEMPVQTMTTWTGRGADAQGRTVVVGNNQNQLEGEGRFLAASASRPARPDSDPMFDDAPFGAVRLEGNSVESAIIMDANKALLKMAEGRSAPGTKFSDLFLVDEDGEDELSSRLIDAIDKPVPLKLAGDEPKSVNVFVTLDNLGQPSVAYIIDMTEQKELELRLAQGEKMQAIGQLAGGVAHDFNNVLTGIMLNNDELMTRHPVGDPSYENLKSIHEFSVRAKDLVHMLLAYARQQTFKREVFDVNDFLSELSILLRQILDERIEFQNIPQRNLPYVKADKNQLETAIFNLVTNARDAMLQNGRAGGSLTIRTSRATGADAHKHGFNFVEDGDYLLIEIADTGHGIPANIMDKIFQPFFTTKDVGVGTGLGLATVYGIIKQSEGYVCPISKVGEGTTFQIYLPALRADEIPQPEIVGPEEEAVDHRPVDISGRGKILLVEDEKGVRDIAVMHLISRGYEVVAAEDGEEALEILEDEAGTFDLVISDVVMPGMDGPALIKAAKEQLGDARVIFISGYAERDLAKKLDDDREVSFLPKPFSVRQLAERVKQQLSLRKEREAA